MGTAKLTGTSVVLGSLLFIVRLIKFVEVQWILNSVFLLTLSATRHFNETSYTVSDGKLLRIMATAVKGTTQYTR